MTLHLLHSRVILSFSFILDFGIESLERPAAAVVVSAPNAQCSSHELWPQLVRARGERVSLPRSLLLRR